MITSLAMKALDFGGVISRNQIYLYSLEESIPLLNDRYRQGEVSEESMLMTLAILTKGYGYYYTNGEYIIILEADFAAENRKHLRSLIMHLEIGIQHQKKNHVIIDSSAFLIFCDMKAIEAGARAYDFIQIIKSGHWFTLRASLKYFKLNLFEKIGVSIAILLYHFSKPVRTRLNYLKGVTDSD